jgi:hypothetical protein
MTNAVHEALVTDCQCGSCTFVREIRQTTRHMPLENRKEAFGILFLKFADDGLMSTAKEMEELAALFHLTTSPTGDLGDALQ